ncbi:MAG: GWxTD domain-containing protein [Bryobacteraceae bacterium]
MTFLEGMVRTPAAGALGWALVHSLWEGALIAAVLGGLLTATRSSRIRYAAACLAMLALLGGSGLTLVHMLPSGTSGFHGARRGLFSDWSAAPGADGFHSSDGILATMAPWLAPVWITGVLAFYLWQAAGWVSLRRLRRRGVCTVAERWQTELTRLAERLRISRPVMLFESCLAEAPVVLGHLRPLILMPAGMLAGLPPGQAEAILLHELAHVRRCDYLINLVQRLVEGLFFYHPAAWWMARVIRIERENCCDDVVVASGGNAREYAVALATLEEKRWSGQPAVAATGGNLMKRIHRLLYPQRPNSAWTPVFAAMVLVVSMAAALTAWQAPPSAQSPADAQAGSSQWARWLNQEVVYIIADEERAAFEGLRTDEERAKFIEQFWLRRDPTPGTPQNEFKEEHYRRIGYAAQHFRTASGRPGGQTDRGHMYIVYGPPDEIESHPAGGKSPYASEVWLYRHVEGIGDTVFITFIDRTGRGDYRLAPGNGQVPGNRK